ncbi:hypothetical protein HY949_02680 [Candidatus Gottesmanbacteria bacterium]|nr:hypothetical protein [Candidatus Gottesmanbacteria bacterium]
MTTEFDQESQSLIDSLFHIPLPLSWENTEDLKGVASGWTATAKKIKDNHRYYPGCIVKWYTPHTPSPDQKRFFAQNAVALQRLTPLGLRIGLGRIPHLRASGRFMDQPAVIETPVQHMFGNTFHEQFHSATPENRLMFYTSLANLKAVLAFGGVVHAEADQRDFACSPTFSAGVVDFGQSWTIGSPLNDGTRTEAEKNATIHLAQWMRETERNSRSPLDIEPLYDRSLTTFSSRSLTTFSSLYRALGRIK